MDQSNRDFYSTIAQVLPVILLALMWDSGYLDRLRSERRTRRRAGTPGVWFWTKPRVRAYTSFVGTVMVAGLGVAVVSLTGAVPDSAVLRALLTGTLLLGLGTLLTRLLLDVWKATVEPDAGTRGATPEDVDRATPVGQTPE